MGSVLWVPYYQTRQCIANGPIQVLGAMSKALATLVTQPLIVAKVGLQSRTPPARQGKPFKSFVEVMSYIVEHEGPLALFKGIAPQITKGILVQGLLMMTKERFVSFPCAVVEMLTRHVGWSFSSSPYSRICDNSGLKSCRKWPRPPLSVSGKQCLR